MFQNGCFFSVFRSNSFCRNTAHTQTQLMLPPWQNTGVNSPRNYRSFSIKVSISGLVGLLFPSDTSAKSIIKEFPTQEMLLVWLQSTVYLWMLHQYVDLLRTISDWPKHEEYVIGISCRSSPSTSTPYPFIYAYGFPQEFIFI